MPRRNVVEFLITARDNASGKFGNVESSIGGVNDAVTRLAGITAGALGTREIAQFADTWRLMQNRMRLVTADTRELATVTKELVELSIETRSSYESTANLYARVARSSRELGISQQELLDFTKTVQQSIRISGSTAAEASAGVIQFGQALASSRLSGDELRSVLEQMPRLAQAIAEGMGVGIGTLRELGEKGELSADKVLDALRKAAPEIEEEFKDIDKLVSEAFIVLRSSMMVAIGTIDQVAGVSKFLAESLIDVAEQIVLVGSAIAGNLSKEQLGEVTEGAARAAIAILVMSNSLKVLAQSAFDTSVFAITSMTDLITAALDTKSIYKPDEIIAAFEIIKRRGVATFTDLNDDIFTDTVDMIEKIQKILGNVELMPFDASDLTPSSDPRDDLTRKQREEMARNLNTLNKLRDSLQNQVAAQVQAAITGEDFAFALQRIKVNSLAAAAGNAGLAAEVLQLMNLLKQQKDIAADKEVLESLNEELRLIGMTNQQRFVYLELQKLSAEATTEQMDAVQLAAEQLFAAQEALRNEMKFMENLAEQAAKNILDAFADFLFDPFDEGVMGMLEGFLTALRQMLAQALAFQVLSGIPGISELLPTRAAGGPITAGMPVLVGERGPELFIPTSPGTIRNNSATFDSGGGAGMNFTTHIDARGADPGLIARLPAIMEDRDRRLMLAVQRFVTTGHLPI